MPTAIEARPMGWISGCAFARCYHDSVRYGMWAMGVVLCVGGCGRSSFYVGNGPIAEGGSESEGAVPGPADDPEIPPQPDPDPEPDLPPVEIEDDCGDGVIDPGDLCFEQQVIFPSRIDPCSIDIGDIDDDGHLDVAVPNSDFEHIESEDNIASVLYGDGRGNLSAPQTMLAGGDVPVGLAIADLDFDGDDDIVVANNEAGQLTAMLGDGARTFGAPASTSLASSPSIVAAGDFNGDGLADAAVTLTEDGLVAIALSQGGGSFAPPVTVATGLSPWAVRLADVNDDGTLDVVATDTSTNVVSAYYGRGDGTLFPNMASYEVGFGATDVLIVDVDADGFSDMLTANRSDGTVSVLTGNGDGSYAGAIVVPTEISPRALAVADFNADGIPDIAIAHENAEVVTFLLGRGDGGFGEDPRQWPIGTLPSGIRAGDFNEDGIDDLAVSNQLDNNVGLILSNP